jgi:hypothetical protein
MLRGPKVALSVALALVLLGGTAAAIYRWLDSRRGLTPDEYRVYRALLTRLAADNNWRRTEVALSNTTQRLEDPHPDSWVPKELQPDKMIPPQDVVSFCGDLCGREFVRKNLVEWPLSSTAQDEVGFPIVGPSKEIPPEIPPKYRVVGVTRVGFNVWHTRAFLSYSADCNDYSPRHLVICLELGDAYLEKKNGAWDVNDYRATTF